MTHALVEAERNLRTATGRMHKNSCYKKPVQSIVERAFALKKILQKLLSHKLRQIIHCLFAHFIFHEGSPAQ